MPLFLDASAWAKLYVLDENGSEAMQALFARPELGDEFFASRRVAIEMVSSLRGCGLGRRWPARKASTYRRAALGGTSSVGTGAGCG